MASVSDLITNVNTLVKDLANAVEGVPSIPLARTIESVNKILGQVNGLLAGDTTIPIANVITGLNDVLSNLKSILSDPSGLLPRLVETEETKGSISRLLTSLDNTLVNVEQLTGNANEQIAPLLLQVQTLLKQVQDVAEGLKNNPLVKGGVPSRMEKESATPKLREENF
jgi:phospholipid/cholesterol/gamma-HCH transport system substrate-binding protein